MCQYNFSCDKYSIRQVVHQLGQAYEKSLLSLTFAVNLELLYEIVLILKGHLQVFFLIN